MASLQFRHLALAIAALAGCDERPLAPRSRVVAVVAGHRITADEIERRIAELPASERPKDRAVTAQLVLTLVDVEVLAAEARGRGLDADPAVRAMLDAVRVQALLGEKPAPESIPAAAVAAYFRANQAAFAIPERRRVEALPFDDRAAAVAARVRAGEDWHVLATARGAPEDGDLGNVGPPDDGGGANERIAAPLRQAVFALAALGDVSEPVAAGGRFFLVRYAGHTAPELHPFEHEEANIRRVLAEQRFAAHKKRLIAEYRSRARISIDEAALESVEVPDISGGYDPSRWKKR